MILTGHEIQREVLNNRIWIDPFNPNQVNPNSYDFRLGHILLVYKQYLLDVKIKNETETIHIPKDGLVLQPGRIYLGHTLEIMGSPVDVPIIRAKSSIARLGLFIHITADLIDVGSHNQWTLQLNPVRPIRIYPEMLIGQVTFWMAKGEITPYTGKYQGSRGPMASQAYLDFSKNS